MLLFWLDYIKSMDIVSNQCIGKWWMNENHRQFWNGQRFRHFVTRNWIWVFLLFLRYWKPLKVCRHHRMCNKYSETWYFQLFFYRYLSYHNIWCRRTSMRMERYVTWCWLDIWIEIFENSQFKLIPSKFFKFFNYNYKYSFEIYSQNSCMFISLKFKTPWRICAWLHIIA